MIADRLAATRSNLLRARAQLGRVRKGAEVVHRKRQALVGHLLRIARPAIDARTEIARMATEAAERLLDALAVDGRDALRALAAPPSPVDVDVEPAQIWGVAVADVKAASAVHRTLDTRATPPTSTSTSASAASDAYEHLVQLLIASAPNEVAASRLAEAVAVASQQLQVLQHRVEPRLVAQIADVRRTLDEREREEQLRLKHLRGVRPSS